MHLKTIALACVLMFAPLGSSWASTASILKTMNEQADQLTQQIARCPDTSNPADCSKRLTAAREQVFGLIARVKTMRTMDDWEQIKRDVPPVSSSIKRIWGDYFPQGESWEPLK